MLPSWWRVQPDPAPPVSSDAQSDKLPHGIEPMRLARKLKCDLDTIVLNALREDPEQRYSSRSTNGLRYPSSSEQCDAIEARPETLLVCTKRLSRNLPPLRLS